MHNREGQESSIVVCGTNFEFMSFLLNIWFLQQTPNGTMLENLAAKRDEGSEAVKCGNFKAIQMVANRSRNQLKQVSNSNRNQLQQVSKPR